MTKGSVHFLIKASLFDSQFGFRLLHLTNHVLITIIEHNKAARDRNSFTSGVYLNFNNFFNLIAIKIDLKIIQIKTNFQYTLKSPNESSFCINSITKEKNKDIIKLLYNRKTTGPNSIPTKVLKQLKKLYLSS